MRSIEQWSRCLDVRRGGEQIEAWVKRGRWDGEAVGGVLAITAPGEIEQLDQPAASAKPGSGTGRVTLRLLGLEDQLNRPLDEENNPGQGHGPQR